MRRGLEAMFENFKSRGFSITQGQIKRPDRLSGLIGVRAIAMYRAVSTRKAQEHDGKQGGEKGGPKSPNILMLALQSRAPRHLEMSRWLRQNPQTPGGLDPLKGGKPNWIIFQRRSILMGACICLWAPTDIQQTSCLPCLPERQSHIA